MSNTFGTAGALAAGTQQPYYGQAQMAANTQLSHAQAQAQAANAFAQWSQQAIERRDWMIDGKPMTFTEFADTLFPENTAERTMFFLKYSK